VNEVVTKESRIKIVDCAEKAKKNRRLRFVERGEVEEG
jgi:hypothetical protein